jgi:nucleotide-binding universal stress UspA family protein
MYRSVLVPLDGSSFGEHALPLAASIARRAKAALQLVHVATPQDVAYAEALLVPDPELQYTLETQQKDYLEQMAKRVESFAQLPVSTSLLRGEVASSIRLHAVKGKVDLVVMTTHGRGALARFWLGSVADELVRHLPIPILLVRPQEGEPMWGHEPVLKHILMPLDGTPLAEQILEPATALGSLMGSDYTLLRAIKPVLPPGCPPAGESFSDRTEKLLTQIQITHERLAREAHGYLEQVAQRLRGRDLRVQTQVLVEGQPGRAILDAIAPAAIDLIALAAHGRRGLSRLVLGSVADKIIRGAAVPVLVQRPAQE